MSDGLLEGKIHIKLLGKKLGIIESKLEGKLFRIFEGNNVGKPEGWNDGSNVGKLDRITDSILEVSSDRNINGKCVGIIDRFWGTLCSSGIDYFFMTMLIILLLA